MRAATIEAFVDELVKIAGLPKAMLEATGKGASTEAKTFLFNRLNAHALGRKATQSKFPLLSSRLEARSWGKANKKKALGALAGGEKRATMVKYTDPKTKTATELAKKINADFGLPLEPPPRRRGVRRYENGPAAAQSADASQYPVAGMATPNISASNTMSPAYGPGGV